MEWLDGCDLESRWKDASLGETDTIDVAMQVAEALSAAHQVGVVHRDIKPGNLFLVDGDPRRVKVLDFGLARLDDVSIALTGSGAVVGTPAFMAPEQASGERRVDGRADLYALGAVMFACLTGQPPFVAGHVMAVLAKVLLEPAARVRDHRPRVSPGLDDVIDRLLAKDPGERFASGVALNANKGMALLTELGGAEEGESLMRLTHAECLHAVGEHEQAARSIAAARDHLLEQARSIDEPAWRASFLENVQENRRTLELAEQWL